MRAASGKEVYGQARAGPCMLRMFDRARKGRFVLSLLLLASLTVITVDFRSKGDGPLDRVGRVALGVLAPVQRGLAAIFRPIGNFAEGFTQVPRLKEDIGRLERENAALRAQREQYEDIVRENEALRKELNLAERFNLRTMPAQVIGLGPSNFERTIIIDKGSADGVRRDLPIICCEGLVGRVLSVGPRSSVVLLIIDRSSAVAARIASTGETGIVHGTGTGKLRFELLDPDAKVDIGDRIVTSGYDRGLYPSGIPVGAVTKAPPTGSNPTRVVEIQPFVDFSTLDYVLLVMGERRAQEATR